MCIRLSACGAKLHLHRPAVYTVAQDTCGMHRGCPKFTEPTGEDGLSGWLPHMLDDDVGWDTWDLKQDQGDGNVVRGKAMLTSRWGEEKREREETT